MARIDQDHVAALLEHVGKVEPDLLPACRWLALGRRLAPLVLSPRRGAGGTNEEWRVPAVGDLARLLDLTDGEAPEIEAAGWALVAAADLGAEAAIEHALDLLVAADVSRWRHPAQVLRSPRPDFRRLLAGCEARLEEAGGETRERLEGVREKLERAAKIEEKARQRRVR